MTRALFYLLELFAHSEGDQAERGPGILLHSIGLQ